MEKYGFVYIWYDRKHKRYYIGCRWGTEDDGYICSSKWMKDSYKRRPQDFKRRILKRNIKREDLLNEEYKWLKMIKNEELRDKYYNLSKHHFGHWSSDINSNKSISDKIKENHAKQEVKEKLRQGKLGDKNPMKNPDVVAKRLETYKRGNHEPWNKGIIMGPNPEHSKRMKGKIPPNANKKAEELYGVERANELKEYFSKFNSERLWYVNPETNICIHILNTKAPPEGYVRGRCKFKKRKTIRNQV